MSNNYVVTDKKLTSSKYTFNNDSNCNMRSTIHCLFFAKNRDKYVLVNFAKSNNRNLFRMKLKR